MIKIDSSNLNQCSGCTACSNICGSNSIIMKTDKEGFKYPKVDLNTCTDCHLCEIICPVISTQSVAKAEEYQLYACYNHDSQVQSQSSSGGAFSVIADYVLNRGGVVYGAAYSAKDEVTHFKVERNYQLNKLRGSKYIQSELGNTFTEIKRNLREGQLVLFSGTPCQVAGLLTFLRRKYDNLITVDFICFGVGSPKLFSMYISSLEQKYNQDVVNFNFRSKANGWKDYGQTGSEVTLANGETKQIAPIYNNSFMLGYSNASILRPICYQCPFKLNNNNISDFKLADFWGVKKVAPASYSEQGTSMLFVNTPIGAEIISDCRQQLALTPVAIEDVLIYQPMLNKSKSMPKERQQLMENLDLLTYQQIERKFMNKYKWIATKVIERSKRTILKGK